MATCTECTGWADEEDTFVLQDQLGIANHESRDPQPLGVQLPDSPVGQLEVVLVRRHGNDLLSAALLSLDAVIDEGQGEDVLTVRWLEHDVLRDQQFDSTRFHVLPNRFNQFNLNHSSSGAQSRDQDDVSMQALTVREGGREGGSNIYVHMYYV